MLESSLKTLEQESLTRGLQRQPTHNVVLLYSAGADSTATGLKLVESGQIVHPLFFDYGQTAASAEEYLATIAPERLGFNPPQITKIAELMKSLSQSVLLGGNPINDRTAWVPARNTLFMVLAGIYAYQVDADGIAVGHILEDQGVYGDSSIIHHRLVDLLLTQSLSRPMTVYTPLMAMTKKETLSYLLDKDALELTVSCWNAQVEERVIQVCDRCANCRERNHNLQLIEDELR